jgi:hypothetical protein
MIQEGKENIIKEDQQNNKKVVFASSFAQRFEHLVTLCLKVFSSRHYVLQS